MDTDRMVLKLENLRFSYPGGKTVLDGLDFTLAEGEKVGIIGPNGSGKSTLLHIILGLLKPDSGKMTILGIEPSGEKDFRAVREKVGLLFQHADDQLFSPTVLEDVAFGPLNLGKTPDQARELSKEVLTDLGLSGFENRITHNLSGGEKKLVALATVLVMRPRVLFLDEPSTGLDETTRERLIEIVNALDITRVIVSHEYDYLARATASIFAMKNGKISFRCDSRHLHSHYHAHPAGELPHEHL